MPTTVFDAAILRLTIRAEHAIALLFPWPVIHAYESALPGTKWRECTPIFALPPEEAIVRSEPAAENRDLLGEIDVPARVDPARAPLHQPMALARFCRSIPPEVRALVRPFHEQQWHLLAWLARAGPGAEQLARSTPALALLLAFSEEFSDQAGGRPLAIPDMGAYQRQRDLVGRLGFPARESVRRLLAKIAYDAVRVDHLRTLRTIAARQDAVQRLAHLPRINAAVIRIAGGDRLVDTPAGVLEELAQAHHDEPAPWPSGAVGLAAIAGQEDGGGDAIAACNADGEIPPPAARPGRRRSGLRTIRTGD
jgi:hypothetical protein